MRHPPKKKYIFESEFLSEPCFRDHLSPFEKGIKIYLKSTALLEIDAMRQDLERLLQQLQEDEEDD